MTGKDGGSGLWLQLLPYRESGCPSGNGTEAPFLENRLSNKASFFWKQTTLGSSLCAGLAPTCAQVWTGVMCQADGSASTSVLRSRNEEAQVLSNDHVPQSGPALLHSLHDSRTRISGTKNKEKGKNSQKHKITTCNCRLMPRKCNLRVNSLISEMWMKIALIYTL